MIHKTLYNLYLDKVAISNAPGNCWSSKRSSILFLGVIFSMISSVISAESEVQNQVSAEQNRAVGYVSLVLGNGYLLNGRKRVTVVPEMDVKAGDSIYTESNGHVHVRFVDGALISVRPGSTLAIERYDFDPMRPENSSVKFNLSEGVTRSISGDAAKSARRRFRLNTPIAAIGVRGTDFVVRADSMSTRALVNEGAIVMAPFSDLCQSDSLGPCSQNAVELVADSFQILELRGTALTPEISTNQPEREMGDLSERFRLARPRVSLVTSETDGGSNAEVYRETVTTGSVSAANSSVAKSSPSVASQSDFTPKTALSAFDVGSDRLVWGRFGSGRGDGERISVDRGLAANGRSITIAASDYLLYRTEPNGARLDSNLGSIGFKLESAQAFFNGSSGELLMGVADGELSVDFIDSTFTTQLGLYHGDLGTFDFYGNGRVADGGYLIGTGLSNKSVVGAVSTDGLEAGYFFEQAVQGGTISGLTLWGGR